MTRTSFLAATAVAALATSSVFVADAQARGFAGHFSRPASHAASRSVSRPVSHSVASHTVNQFRPAAHTVSHPVSQAHSFTQAHSSLTQAHQNLSHTTSQSHVLQTHVSQAISNQAHTNVGLSGQAHTNLGVSTQAHTNFGVSTQAHTNLVASNQAHTNLGTSNQAHISQTHQLLIAHQASGVPHSAKTGQALASQKTATPGQVNQVQNAANADVKQGKADIAKANQLTGASNVLQAKATAEAKTNPKQAAKDSAQAVADLKQASKLQTQGQGLLKDAKAEKAVLASTTNGQAATPGQIQKVAGIAAADAKQGKADIAKSQQLTGAAATLQAKANAEAKTNPKQAAKDSAQAVADLQQASKLQTQGQALLKDAKAEKAVLASLNGSNTPGGQGNNPGGQGNNPGQGNNSGGQGNNTPGGQSNDPGSQSSSNTPGGQSSSTPSGSQSASNTPAQTQTAPTADNNTQAAATQTPATTTQDPAPATTTAAATQATAAPTTVASTTPAPQGTSFKALSLAWNQNGGWVVRVADALPAANTEAITTCDGQFGSCQQAAAVDTSAFGCLAVASTEEHQLFSATGPSLDAVTTSLQQKLESVGTKGEVQYSGCNNNG